MYIACAFLAEALPIIKAYKLKQNPHVHAFPLWEREGFSLIITGPGKISSASAVSYLMGCKNAPGPYLNIGVAGHRTLPIGSYFLANKITDIATHYPSLCFTTTYTTSPLITVDQIEKEYAQNAGYDMEASGFFHACKKFTPIELIQVFKVVSDNRDHPIHKPDPKKATEFINEHIGTIRRLIEDLLELKKEVFFEPHPMQSIFLNNYRFSQTEQHQLRRLLDRCKALNIDAKVEANSGKELLGKLEQLIDKEVLSL